MAKGLELALGQLKDRLVELMATMQVVYFHLEDMEKQRLEDEYSRTLAALGAVEVPAVPGAAEAFGLEDVSKPVQALLEKNGLVPEPTDLPIRRGGRRGKLGWAALGARGKGSSGVRTPPVRPVSRPRTNPTPRVVNSSTAAEALAEDWTMGSPIDTELFPDAPEAGPDIRLPGAGFEPA